MTKKNQEIGSARLTIIIAVVALLVLGGGYLVYANRDVSNAPPRIYGKTEAEPNGPPVVRSAGITVAVPASTTPTTESDASTTLPDTTTEADE